MRPFILALENSDFHNDYDLGEEASAGHVQASPTRKDLSLHSFRTLRTCIAGGFRGLSAEISRASPGILLPLGSEVLAAGQSFSLSAEWPSGTMNANAPPHSFGGRGNGGGGLAVPVALFVAS